MKSANATNLDRKSGETEGPADTRVVFHLCRAKRLRSICFDHRCHMLKYLDVMPGTRLAEIDHEHR
jgi:hypothetical protein